ncbi:Protein of unknown function [Cotesia congregata]|uniref:Uncharacterized protein n=1 Tax=Cotesia congregata TaxID=51543 RepID=A0A8J2HA13_COTCN|nr:Protein of unknown function [Cotesia congregata]
MLGILILQTTTLNSLKRKVNRPAPAARPPGPLNEFISSHRGQIDNRGLSARSAGSAKNCSSDFGGSQSSPIRGIGCNVTESYSKDTDLLAHAASALRRLHFKSAGGSRSCRTVPKVTELIQCG